jgi:nitrate/nitrite-specific signal transduction histidine kinase
MQISKELINNIYKHSAANFINYSCQVKGEDIEIYCESDGASREDYEKTKSSRGGILIVRALVSSNRGEIEYSYKDGLLRTEVKFGMVREDENTFI